MFALQTASLLPVPSKLEEVSRGLAALDAVLRPLGDFRSFTYDPRWKHGARLAKMDDMSGDKCEIIFRPDITVVRAFDHEHAMSPWHLRDYRFADGLLEGFPDDLYGLIAEPSLQTADGPVADLTFCAWRGHDDSAWLAGNAQSDGGARAVLAFILDESPAIYEDEFGLEVSEEFFAHFFELRPVNAALVQMLNPTVDSLEVLAELHKMDYPTD